MGSTTQEIAGTKTRAKDENDKIVRASSTPDKNEIICPLTLKLTGGAVNYDITWLSTVDLGDGPGCWKSTPNNRSHTDQFRAAIKSLRARDIITWDEMAFYFTHEQGKQAAQTYVSHVVSGEPYKLLSGREIQLKAHKRSWGPNPEREPDKSRFHKMGGISFDALKDKFPDLYATQAQKKTTTPTKQAVEVEEPEVIQTAAVDLEMDDVVELDQEPTPVDMQDPSDDELNELENEVEMEEEPEEETVAGVTALEEGIDLDSVADLGDDSDDHSVARVFADSSFEKIHTDCEGVEWKGSDGEMHHAYLIEMPNSGEEYWLEAGKHTINGETIIVELMNTES